MPVSIMANEHSTITFFFPSAISKTIPPTANYTFEYYEDAPSIGLIKGEKGSQSNLTVITEDGYIYSFILKYSENIDNFNFILDNGMSIGRIPSHQLTINKTIDTVKILNASYRRNDSNAPFASEKSSMKLDASLGESHAGINSRNQDEKSVRKPQDVSDANESHFSDNSSESIKKGVGDDLYSIDREEYFRIFCENNYLQKTLVRRTFRQNKNIVLKLNNILVDRSEVFFVLQIENNSKKEYQVNGLSFFRKSGVGQLQKIMKPLYTYNLQDKIDPQSINEVVYVFKRFTISNKERIFVVLDELENNRIVLLPLDNKQINAPTN